MEETGKVKVWAKGSGATGCLLDGSLEDSKEFLALQLGFDLLELEISGSFVLAIDRQNRLFVWGMLENEILKKPVLFEQNVTRISCGNHALFESQGKIWGIGSNVSLELGIQTNQKFVKKPLVVRQDKVEHFICGFRQSYIIGNDSLWGCGQSRKNQLGISQKKPVLWRQISSELNKKTKSKIVELKIGKRFLLMRTEKGDIWALGFNQQNCFNSKEISHLIIPEKIFQNVKKIASGWAHIVMLTSEGKIQTFGRNNLDQLARKQGQDFRLELQEGQNVKDIVSGTQFCFVVTSRGRVFGWGWNEHSNISPCGSWSLSKPKQVVLPQPCFRLWTHPAITVIQYI